MPMRKLTILLLFIAGTRFAPAGTVWIDTDVSIGSPIREVDDAYAIVLALHSGEIRIAGISTSYGNAPLGHTTRAARELVWQFGAEARLRSDQIFAGARSAADLGRRNEASEALAKKLENSSVTYLALGPLTNLATFLQLHPESARKINRVIFVGGQAQGTTLAFGRNGSFRIHDANVFKDPRATAFVLEAKIPLTLVSSATASQLALNAGDLRKLEQGGGAGRYLSRRSKVWLWFWTQFVRTKGGPIFDAGAVVAATRPDLVAMEERGATMDGAGNLIVTRGLTSGARTVRYCTSFAPATKQIIMRRFMARQSPD